MKQGFRIPIALFGCCALLAAGACARSSDGSVVVNAPPSLAFAVPPYLRPDGKGASAQETVSASSFPPPPAAQPVRKAPAKVLPPVKAWKVGGVQAPFKRADSAAPLTCRNETGDGGRVKVVCQ